MSIEEVSVLFDTGRKGDPDAAARQLHLGASEKERALAEDIDDPEKEAQTATVKRIEK